MSYPYLTYVEPKGREGTLLAQVACSTNAISDSFDPAAALGHPSRDAEP